MNWSTGRIKSGVSTHMPQFRKTNSNCTTGVYVKAMRWLGDTPDQMGNAKWNWGVFDRKTDGHRMPDEPRRDVNVEKRNMPNVMSDRVIYCTMSAACDMHDVSFGNPMGLYTEACRNSQHRFVVETGGHMMASRRASRCRCCSARNPKGNTGKDQ